MVIVLKKNGKKYFKDKLLLLIENWNNVEAISMMKNREVQHLTDCDGQSLLHFAAFLKNTVVTQYLIDQGCKEGATDSWGRTPLLYAVMTGHVDTVKLLLKANAKTGKFCNEIFLLRTLSGKGPRDLDTIEFAFDSITSGCIDNNEIALKLVEHQCLLPGVIFLKNAELTKLMLDRHGCSVNDRLPQSNETALHLAIEFFDIANVKVLVDHGADINATDSDDTTPLNRFQILPSGDSDEKLDVLRFLLDRGASLEDAAVFTKGILSKGDVRTISVLMPHLALSPSYSNGFFPLHILVQNENDDIVELLQGKNFDVNAHDYGGYTPLDRAADRNRLRMIQFLLENGADPNNINESGGTTLSFLIGESFYGPEKYQRVVELFLQYGANAQFLREGEFPVFDADREENFVLVQPVLAHLAMIESFGELLNKYVRREIEASELFKNYFETCKLQIEVMKNTMMYESVTLYSLLSECKEKIAILSRIDEFVSNYELFVKNNKNEVNSYYISTIRFRVDKTLDLVQMKEKVAYIVCEMMSLPPTMIDAIGHNIVKYLLPEDLENVLRI